MVSFSFKVFPSIPTCSREGSATPD